MSKVELLPIGSIVILKGSTKKMMLIARMIAVPVDGVVYRFDYGACLYPEGLVGDNLIYFNDEDILKVIHEGYSDEDNEIMLENISNVIENTDLPKGKVSELIKNQK
ncbi:DUF4176 domain-containing protein [Parvimonas micra]|jgi:hypothetical protein|uniref:DUF4176 domain-containing protein n=1 Tax=Parvimonas micra TaxID=33033 RepID=UPI002003A048|nr:DUF4176 domain-containing protein [Parvimonas micra]MCK6130456.1 DUF4176 domain-containing protein [Parvimonas micra]MCK6136103.1 DUF4176 domain-containing protein [Parvimonas micra]MCK6137574.1 DUF4176 domain-containing protein [Parvimonas micra]MCK6154102.1 DUF4176 domain-containing protein [Parvimonas micra]